ncbi:MAG TPA: energy transducer TonB [Xanthomonadaceae bacterium]|nr:energy transducer TonB [Xanthomonadaceae bacterium]
MTENLPKSDKNDDREGLNWARIAGLAFAIAMHVAALLVLLAPIAPPEPEAEEKDVTLVNFIRPPPPPPPPPPPDPTPPKPKEIRELTPPRPTPIPPPPDPPPVVFDDPSPVDTPAPPPAPPSPPAPATNIGSSVDPSSRANNPPEYPREAIRENAEGTVVLLIHIDAQGNVLDIEVERSSRNRDLDRSAVQAARRWRFNPAIENGVPVRSTVRIPVDFTLPR